MRRDLFIHALPLPAAGEPRRACGSRGCVDGSWLCEGFSLLCPCRYPEGPPFDKQLAKFRAACAAFRDPNCDPQRLKMALWSGPAMGKTNPMAEAALENPALDLLCLAHPELADLAKRARRLRDDKKA